MIKLYKIQAINKITKQVKFVIEDGYFNFTDMTSIEEDGTMFTENQAEAYINIFNSHESNTHNEYEFSKLYTHLVYDPDTGEMTDDMG